MQVQLQLPVFYILLILGSYFFILILISYLLSRSSKSKNQDFFIASRQSKWYLVSYGMIGASLSGVTFISIPGVVGAGKENMAFSYMQVVLGYFVGYFIIAKILLPIYYKKEITSIYEYLKDRFGNYSYTTGAILFILSRLIGSAFRLYLVVLVMDMIFKAGGLEIPFIVLCIVSVLLIWVYTFKSGMKTIIWTDTLQTSFMLIAVISTVIYILHSIPLSKNDIFIKMDELHLSQMFFWENGWSNPNHFLKQFLGGIFITIVMTGLDQDMMQKNLSCKNLKEAQKNMFSFSLVLIFVNFIFLCLGALLFVYYEVNSIPFPLKDAGDPNSIAYDLIYPNLAMGYLPVFIGIIFIIGFVAAAYSTADSALTALTTSFCIDILKVNPGAEDQTSIKKRQLSHLLMSALLVMTIYSFWLINNKSVINQLFTMAGYTYGPLLGLFAFGIFTKRKIRDPYIIIIALASPLLTYLIHSHSSQWFWGYKFGFELLILNGLFSFLGLYLISRKSD